MHTLLVIWRVAFFMGKIHLCILKVLFFRNKEKKINEGQNENYFFLKMGQKDRIKIYQAFSLFKGKIRTYWKVAIDPSQVSNTMFLLI